MLRRNYEVTNNFIFIVQFSLVDNKLSRPDRISAKCLWKSVTWLMLLRIKLLYLKNNWLKFCFKLWKMWPQVQYFDKLSFLISDEIH